MIPDDILTPEGLPKNKEDYMLDDQELTKLTEFLKSALDVNLFTLSLRVLENKSLNIPFLNKVLPKDPTIPPSISEKTPLGFFYNTQDPAFITKLNQALVGNHFMGRIRGWTEVQQIKTVLTTFIYELLPTEIQIDENQINEKIQQIRFTIKDGKLYALYGDKSIELRWEYIFTPIMHRTPLHVFNLNSKMANEFIQQLIQEMGDRELSYEQFMDLLKQTKLKLKK
jgi:hypothetical protein